MVFGLSFTLHLTSGVSVCLKNDTAYLTSNEGQYICAVFSLLQRCGVICISWQCLHPYLVFVATEASLLVRKANDILNTTRNISQ